MGAERWSFENKHGHYRRAKMCVFMYMGNNHSFHCFLFRQYKFEAKLEFGVCGGKRVNRVECVIIQRERWAGTKTSQHEVFLLAAGTNGKMPLLGNSVTQRRTVLHGPFYAKVRCYLFKCNGQCAS